MAVPISVPGDPSSPLTYTVPGSTAFIARAASASFDGSVASGSFLPTMTWIAQSGEILGRYTAPEVAVGGSAEVSWFPSGRKRVAASGLTLDYNLGELGGSIGTASASFQFANIDYQDINQGDGILILAAAPSVRAALATPARPIAAFDSAANTYTALGSFAFEASPPNVNEGVYVTLFWCPSSVTALAAGFSHVSAVWDGNVFDRIVEVWAVRHSGGAHTPTVLAATPDNDAAVFASTQVTLTAPDFTPARDKALEFALVVSAKAGVARGFGGVSGWSGFFQAEFREFAGSKQSYFVNPQTHGADAYLIAGAVPAPYEDDIGVLPGGALVPSFNGVAQSFFDVIGGVVTPESNAWKGIILLGLD